MIAAVGCYLTASNGRKGISLCYEDDVEYIETPINLDITISPFGDIIIDNAIGFRKTSNLKRDFITSIWSNDDQIAIILNREDTEQDFEMYDFMQQWRAYFSTIVEKVKSL